MTFRKRQAKLERAHPITDRYKLWAWWFAGCIAHHHPGRISGPVHPIAAREFYSGQDAARDGYVKVPDYAEGIALLRHVEAGNPPHTFKGDQREMAL